MFKTDYQIELVKEGEYEAQIIKAELLAAETGTKYMNITYRIREDVEQEHQGEVVFDKLWQNKTTGEYNMRRFNNICKSAGIPEGTSFANENSFLEAIVGKAIVVNVAVVFDDFRQQDQNTILYYRSSKVGFKTVNNAPTQTQTTKPVSAPAPAPEEDDDLPW